jgi:hypothetical protein
MMPARKTGMMTDIKKRHNDKENEDNHYEKVKKT